MTITVSTRNNSLCWRSVLTFFGVNEVFENAIRAALCARWRYILFNFYSFLLMQIHFVWILCYTVAVIFLPLMHRHCSNSLLVSTQINTIHQHYLLRIKRQTELFLPTFFAISENTLHTTSQPDESSTIPHRVYFLHFFPSPFLCTCKAFGLLCWIICHLPNPPSR